LRCGGNAIFRKEITLKRQEKKRDKGMCTGGKTVKY